MLREEGTRVRTCVTSPPYWGLRAYGTEPQVWANGHETCAEHEWNTETRKGMSGGASDKQDSNRGSRFNNLEVGVCSRCGAWRGELGLEPTPELYVAHLVEVFRAVRDVLAENGTLWLNLGDSYAGGKGQNARHDHNLEQRRAEGRTMQRRETTISDMDLLPHDNMTMLRERGIKPKDLVGIPWMVAFALRADGWYLRSDIIWHKPNPMPESVTDRPTKSHEYIFLLSKSARYYYDAEAIAEPLAYPNETRRPLGSKGAWEMDGREQRENGGGLPYDGYPQARNKRSVWTVPTHPYKDAHFATFPLDLIEPCILAGSTVDDIVLDAFGGSGTVAQVAIKNGRRAILIDLNPKYVELQKKRLHGVQMRLR